jgi:GTP-binding protein Era
MKPKNIQNDFKVGKVAIVGRPNVGKSTMLNSFVKQKVSIVSEKPQTTRSQVEAVYEDSRGQIFFMDSPGLYLASGTPGYNQMIWESVALADVVLYVVDHTRSWGEEDERLWNQLELIEKPLIVAINKIDKTEKTHKDEYLAIVSKKATKILEVSALKEQHLSSLVEVLYEYLPVGERDKNVDYFATPLLSQSGPDFVGEIIREKIFIHMNQEIPYNTWIRNVEVKENEEQDRLSIKAEIWANNSRYKPMLIGKNGSKIREITAAVENELSVASNKKVSVKLTIMIEK